MSRHWRRAHRLVCQQAVELISDYLDGALEPAAHRRLEAHLAGCPACTAYLDQMRATLAVLGHLPPEGLPTDVLDELVTVFRQFHGD